MWWRGPLIRRLTRPLEMRSWHPQSGAFGAVAGDELVNPGSQHLIPGCDRAHSPFLSDNSSDHQPSFGHPKGREGLSGMSRDISPLCPRTTYVPFTTKSATVHTFSHVQHNASPDTRDVD